MTIYMFGFLNLFALILSYIMLPNILNKGSNQTEDDDEYDEDNILEEINN